MKNCSIYIIATAILTLFHISLLAQDNPGATWIYNKSPEKSGWNADKLDPRLEGGYSATGTYGQTISIFPKINTVVVFKTKDAYERYTTEPAKYRLIKLAVQSFEGKS